MCTAHCLIIACCHTCRVGECKLPVADLIGTNATVLDLSAKKVDAEAARVVAACISQNRVVVELKCVVHISCFCVHQASVPYVAFVT